MVVGSESQSLDVWLDLVDKILAMDEWTQISVRGVFRLNLLEHPWRLDFSVQFHSSRSSDDGPEFSLNYALRKVFKKLAW